LNAGRGNRMRSARGSYEEPAWSLAPPSGEFNVEVLKDGCVVDTIALEKKAFFVFGRDAEASDVPLKNPSISRKHLVIQFSKTGHVFLYDLGSTHGTFLNKTKLEHRRFTEIRVGDMFVVGSSTRKYLLNGPHHLLPQEYDSENLRKLRDERRKKNEEIKLKMNALNSHDNNDDNDDDCRHTKDVSSSADGEASNYAFLDGEEDDDDDDFFDRTKSQVRSSKSRRTHKHERSDEGRVWTREDLEKDVVRLSDRCASAETQLQRALLTQEVEHATGDATEDASDALAAYMQSSRRQLSDSEVIRLRAELDDLHAQRKRRFGLLRLAASEYADKDEEQILRTLRETTAALKKNRATEELARERKRRRDIDNAERSNGAPEKVRIRAGATPAQMRFAVNLSDSKSRVRLEKVRPVSDAKFALPLPRAPIAEAASDFKMPLPRKDVKKEDGSARHDEVPEPPADLASSRNAKRRRRNRAKNSARRLMIGPVRGETQPRASDETILEDGAAAWVPPENQTGDGTTHLNAKYGY